MPIVAVQHELNPRLTPKSGPESRSTSRFGASGRREGKDAVPPSMNSTSAVLDAHEKRLPATPQVSPVGLPTDLALHMRQAVEAEAHHLGALDLAGARVALTRALEAVGVDVTGAPGQQAKMAERALRELVAQGRLATQRGGTWRPIRWWGLRDHPDHEVGELGHIRNRTTGQTLAIRRLRTGKVSVKLGSVVVDPLSLPRTEPIAPPVRPRFPKQSEGAPGWRTVVYGGQR